MNTTLFRSRHAAVAGAVVVAFLIIAFSRGAPFGRAPGHDRAFLLATGWATLATLVVVVAYVLRKYAHRGGYSPEFRMRVEHGALERADARIQRLRQRVDAGAFSSRKLVLAEADAILRSEGVHRVNRVLVSGGGAPWTVTVRPREPLGRVARWMHVHAYYGAAFGALLFMHAGLEPRAGFGVSLAALGYVTLITGIVGIVLWANGPRWLTQRERDLSIEEASALAASLRRKRTAALEQLDPAHRAPLEALSSGGRVDGGRVKETVDALTQQAPEMTREIRDVAALIAQEKAVSAELRDLRRVRASFMLWRYVHIPAALLLTLAVLVHLVSIWKY